MQNDIEKAIKSMENAKLVAEKFLDRSAIQNFSLAIQALQEKQEREKYCEGCNGRESVLKGKPYQCMYCSRNYSDKHDLCGRKLNKPPEVTE